MVQHLGSEVPAHISLEAATAHSPAHHVAVAHTHPWHRTLQLWHPTPLPVMPQPLTLQLTNARPAAVTAVLSFRAAAILQFLLVLGALQMLLVLLVHQGPHLPAGFGCASNPVPSVCLR